jgi:hypothetical protein
MLAMFPCAGRAKTIDTGQADLIGGYTPVAASLIFAPVTSGGLHGG